ncbi:MAG: flippase-like domain-containing protein [Candidatus Omnitrophica bacterium]|nr:flippase-like domain-containing protein [Candidatus Omnitrophota bacterium]
MVNKNKLLFCLRSVVSFGLLFTLLWIMRSSIKDIAGILQNSNKFFFALGFLLNISLSLLLPLRLKYLMKGQDIDMTFSDALYLTYIGYFFNNFLPTAIGGDLVKAHYASKKTNNNIASYAAIAADRLCGLVSVIALALVGLAFFGNSLGNKKIFWAVILMASALIIFLVILLNKKIVHNHNPAKSKLFNAIARNFSKLYNAINSYKDRRWIVVKSLYLSIIAHLGAVFTIYIFIVAMDGDINFIKLFLIVPLVWTLSMLPSLNGLGVREGAFVYFLKGDIGADMAFTVSMLWLGMIIVFSIIGGVLHLLYPVEAKNKEDSSC